MLEKTSAPTAAGPDENGAATSVEIDFSAEAAAAVEKFHRRAVSAMSPDGADGMSDRPLDDDDDGETPEEPSGDFQHPWPAAMAAGNLPDGILEHYEILDPKTPEAKEFDAQMQALARRLYARRADGSKSPSQSALERDFDKDPVRFLLSTKTSKNAFYFRGSRPGIVVLHAGLFLGEGALTLDETAAVVCHEMGHAQSDVLTDGKKKNSKTEEGGADLGALPLLADAGLDPHACLSLQEKLTGGENDAFSDVLGIVDVHPGADLRKSVMETGLGTLRLQRGTLKEGMAPLPAAWAQLAASARPFVRAFPEKPSAAELLRGMAGLDLALVPARQARFQDALKRADWSGTDPEEAGRLLDEEAWRARRVRAAMGDRISTRYATACYVAAARALKVPALGCAAVTVRAARRFSEACAKGTDAAVLEAAREFLAATEIPSPTHALYSCPFPLPTDPRAAPIPCPWNRAVKLAEKEGEIFKALVRMGLGWDPRLFKVEYAAWRKEADFARSVKFVGQGADETLNLVRCHLVPKEYCEKGFALNKEKNDMGDGSPDQNPHTQRWGGIVFDERAGTIRLASSTKDLAYFSDVDVQSVHRWTEQPTNLEKPREKRGARPLPRTADDASKWRVKREPRNEQAEYANEEPEDGEKKINAVQDDLDKARMFLDAFSFPNYCLRSPDVAIHHARVLLPYDPTTVQSAFEKAEIVWQDGTVVATWVTLVLWKHAEPGTRASKADHFDFRAAASTLHAHGWLAVEVSRGYPEYPENMSAADLARDLADDGKVGPAAATYLWFRVGEAVAKEGGVDERLARTLARANYQERLRTLAEPVRAAFANAATLRAMETWPTDVAAEYLHLALSQDLHPARGWRRTIESLLSRIGAEGGGNPGFFETLLSPPGLPYPDLRDRAAEAWARSVAEAVGTDDGAPDFFENKLADAVDRALGFDVFVTAEALNGLAERTLAQGTTLSKMESAAFGHAARADARGGQGAGETAEGLLAYTKATGSALSWLGFFTGKDTDEACRELMAECRYDMVTPEERYAVRPFLFGSARTMPALEKKDVRAWMISVAQKSVEAKPLAEDPNSDAHDKEGQKTTDAQVKAAGPFPETAEDLLAFRASWQMFWGLPFAGRTIYMKELLRLGTANKDDAFRIAMGRAFPGSDERSAESRKFVQAYLDALPKYLYGTALAALVSASERNGESAGNVGATLARFAELMGPAETKMAQCAANHPDVPADIRKDLQHLKYRADIPYRWDAYRLAERVVAQLPESLVPGRAWKFGRLLGSGSLAVTMEIVPETGSPFVVSVTRERAQKRSDAGFDTAARAIKNHGATGTAAVLGDLLADAKKRVATEVDDRVAEAQCLAAQQLYRGRRVAAPGGGEPVRFEAADLLAGGDGWVALRLVEGEHYSEMPSGVEKTRLAEAVLALEFHNLLNGRFDADRHGGNIKCLPGKVAHYDFRGMALDDWSAADWDGLAEFVADVAGLKTFGWEGVAQAVGSRQNAGRLVNETRKALLSLGEYVAETAPERLGKIFLSALLQGVHPELEKRLAARVRKEKGLMASVAFQTCLKTGTVPPFLPVAFDKKTDYFKIT